MADAGYPVTLPALAWQQGMEQDGHPLVPLYLDMHSCATEPEMNANVAATRARGYVRINEYLSAYRGSASIVGAGPSIERYYGKLTGDVFAINSAIGYLLSRGVVPKFGVIWDAAEICESFATPHPDITYLIAARCHQKVFERLKDCKVIVWYAGGDHNIKQYMEEHGIDEPMINGGSAGVTRALYLAYALGYRDFHVYGGDSCYAENGQTHINGSLVPEKDFKVFVDGEWFRTTPEWCAQVEEYKCIHPLFQHPDINATIEVHGDGTLLRFIHERIVVNEQKLREQGIPPWAVISDQPKVPSKQESA